MTNWWTIEYNAQRVEHGARFFELYPILGYLPISNGKWFNHRWVESTHFGMPSSVRVFIDCGSEPS